MIGTAAALLRRNPGLYEFARYGIYARLRSAFRGSIFRAYYERRLWDSDESASGPGSTLVATENVRRELPRLLADLGAHSVLDMPCGDFAWMQHVDLGGIQYIGADLVPAIINANLASFTRDFRVLDLLRDPLPKADVVLCRDCLNHLSNAEIKIALRNIEGSASSGGSRISQSTGLP